MSIVQAIADSASDTVTVGDLMWKVRRVEPKDMLSHGVQGVLILQDILSPGKGSATVSDPRKMSAGQRNKLIKAQVEINALVCAGITHVRQVGGVWEEANVVMEGPSADGRLWINDLPPGTVEAVYPVIFSLAAPEATLKRLRTFLGEPAEADTDQEGGPLLREVAP